MPDATIHFRLDHVLTTVQGASERALLALALQTEGHVKVKIRDNDQVDTGFMLNSVYSVGNDTSGYSAAKGIADRNTKSRRTGADVDHAGDMAPERRLPRDVAAAVVVGANYAIYQEVKQSFLYAGALEAAKQAEGTCEKVFRQEVHD